jgi:hypothetical protein
MKLRPTLLKSLVSIIAGIIANFLLAGSIYGCGHLPDGSPVCTYDPWIAHTFDPVPVVLSLLAIVIVYLIWSYFQK